MADFSKLITIIIFAFTYFFVIRYYEKKDRVVWLSIFAILLFGIVTPFEAFKAINWNVLGIYFGMLFISEIFIYSKVPDFLAVLLINRAKYISTVFILIAVFAGFLSIFVENVAVVLIVAPIALAITSKFRVSPVLVLIAIAISSNLQGVATLIGDPPSMLMAGFAKLNFNDFFFFDSKPSLFFAVQIGAIVSVIVLYFVFKKFKHKHKTIAYVKPASYFPGILLALLIAALAMSSFFDPEFKYLAGLLTLIFGFVALAWYSDVNSKDVKPLLKRVDWETGVFLAGIFILVHSIIVVGFVDDVANWISGFTGNSVAFTYITIIIVSLIFSAVVDNVPFIATMLPVVYKIAEIMNVNPILFYFGLVIGASVGGNITPVGASANIVAMGIAEKNGYKTNFWQFVKVGLPFTLVSVFASTLFVYIIFS